MKSLFIFLHYKKMETNANTIAQTTSGGIGIWAIIIWIIVVLVLYVIVKYNTLVKLRNFIKNAFADIDVQMKLRFDLVENLVNTVKGYAIHEKETLAQLTQARSNYMNAKDENAKIEANNQLNGTLKTLFAVSENYPELKANQNFLQLQTELSDIENKIAAARRFFNSCVKDFNTAIETFPTNVIANLFGFRQHDFFAIENEEEKKAPKVQF